LNLKNIFMRYLEGNEIAIANSSFLLCKQEAIKSPCLRAKSGSVIVKSGVLIGRGFNGPPNGITLERCLKDELPKDFKSDNTCCVHAEQRAIINALRNNPLDLLGSRLYFLRLDLDNQMQFAGKPYCTICSKLALDVGIKEFVLWHKDGIAVYDTQEYNELSFAFRR